MTFSTKISSLVAPTAPTNLAFKAAYVKYKLVLFSSC